MDGLRTLGFALKALRKARGLSQEELASRAGRSVEAVSNVERGLNLPNLETLAQLAEALDIEMRDFFEACQNDDERTQLLAEVIAAARSLDTKDLAVAVRQLQAFQKRE